jgi:hypothetical protein
MHFRNSLLGTTALAAAAMLLSAPAMAGSADTNLAASHAAKGAMTMDALEKRVQALEKAGAARTVSRTKKTMSLTLSGQMHRAVVIVDDGVASRVSVVNSSQSPSTIRVVGKGNLTDDISVETYIEIDDGSQGGTATSIANEGTDGNRTLITDKYALKLNSKTFGRLTVGRFSEASDAIAYADLTGTNLPELSGQARLNANADSFRNSTTGARVATLGAVFNGRDGVVGDVIRYDTPKFFGAYASVDRQNNDDWSVAIRWAGAFGGVKARAQMSYEDNKGSVGTVNGATALDHGFAGSGSILFPFGLGFTIEGGKHKGDGVGRNHETLNGRVGYRFNALELGETRLFLSYGMSDDNAAAGDEGRSIGLGVVQVAEPLGAELYLSYHNFDLDRTGTPTDDLDLIQIGSRFRF